MVELSVEDNRTNLKNKLLELGEKLIVGLCSDLCVSLPEHISSKEALADFFIQDLMTKNQINSFDNLQKYLEFYPEIDSFSKDFIKSILPLGLRKNIKSKLSKEEARQYLTTLVLDKSIDVDKLGEKTRVYSVVSKIRKIKNNELTYLANGLWDNVEENMERDEIIKKITTELEFKKYAPEKVEEILNRNKDSQKKVKSKNASVLKAKVENTSILIEEIKLLKNCLLSIEKLLKKQDQQISDINYSLKRINDNINSNQDKMLSTLENLKNMSNLENTENLLLALRKESLSRMPLEQRSFDLIKESIKKTDISDINLLRDGLSVVVIDYLMKMTKEIDWEISLDLFYKILSEEFYRLIKGSMSTIAEIPQVREKVCKRMGIKAEKFDSLLLKCFDIQWVNLEVGTPIGETDVAWLDTGKNRFYYVKLLRK